MAEATIKISFERGVWNMTADGDTFSIGGAFETPANILSHIEEMMVEMMEPGWWANEMISRAKPIDPPEA